jgi:hypothetical protein
MLLGINAYGSKCQEDGYAPQLQVCHGEVSLLLSWATRRKKRSGQPSSLPKVACWMVFRYNVILATLLAQHPYLLPLRDQEQLLRCSSMLRMIFTI